MPNDSILIKNKIISIKKISKAGVLTTLFSIASFIIFIAMFIILKDYLVVGWDLAKLAFQAGSLSGDKELLVKLAEFNTMVVFLSLFVISYVISGVISLISLLQSNKAKNMLQQTNPEVANADVLIVISKFQSAAQIGIILPIFCTWSVFSKAKKLELSIH